MLRGNGIGYDESMVLIWTQPPILAADEVPSAPSYLRRRQDMILCIDFRFTVMTHLVLAVLLYHQSDTQTTVYVLTFSLGCVMYSPAPPMFPADLAIAIGIVR